MLNLKIRKMKKGQLLLGLFLAMLISISCVQETKSQVVWPFANATTTTSTADTITLDLGTVFNTMNVVTISAATLDSALTVNISTLSDVRVGSVLQVWATADGYAEVITWGTNITGSATTVTANKTDAITFMYNGTAFIKTTEIQTD